MTDNAPLLFSRLSDLESRLSYLRSKAFSDTQINAIVKGNPYWLDYEEDEIDRRLGFFQENFSLSGKQTRALAAEEPRLITWGGVPVQIR